LDKAIYLLFKIVTLKGDIERNVTRCNSIFSDRVRLVLDNSSL